MKSTIITACSILVAMIATASAEREVKGDGFTVVIEQPSGAAGAPVVARVVARAADGYHVNREYPASLVVTAAAGVIVDRPRQELRDARVDDRTAVFEVKLTPQRAGSHALQAKLRFAVCTATQCLPRKAALSWSVDAR